MLGYKIKINCIPQPIWACDTTFSNYMWKNKNTKEMLEISFSSFTTKNVSINEQNYILHNNELACVAEDEKRKAFCNAKEKLRVISIAVKLEDWEYSVCELSEEDYFDKSSLLLPMFIDNISLADELNLIKIMHKIIQAYSDFSENNKAIFISDFFKLLYESDKFTRSCLIKNIPNTKNLENYYIKKVDYLIKTNFQNKVSLNNIASELNISAVYLSTIYKQYTGITFSNKLNQIRMKHAEALLLNQNIPTSKIAELCGFCDDNYFRKQFKKFFGVNVREYRALKNGITLYHDKPTSDNYIK